VGAPNERLEHDNGRTGWRGEVVTIHIAAAAGAPMEERAVVTAVAGRGIIGDRYFAGEGFYSYYPGPLREISLIEEETLEALARDHDLTVALGATRRNIVTRGVPLNHLVGREFRVGGALLRGVKLCEPCKHLVEVTGQRSLLPSLIHRGGLHAEIVADGEIQVGDPVFAQASD
jgi:MOSC domain-containing protein YiiM